METFFLFATSILAVLLLVLSIILFILYRNSRCQLCQKEKLISDISHEIDEQRTIIKNLSKLYENTQQYDKSITDFFSNIIHDLKTPISVILGAIQLLDLKRQGITEEQNKFLKNYQIIKHNCYRLLRLANNLLDFTRLDSGYMKLNPVNFNIVYLVEEITQSVMTYAKQKQLDLIFDTQHEEINTAVDLDKIERVILNLLSNAIKFTPQGGSILVSVFTIEDKVSISIKDNGIGIPEEKHKEIFERFRQAGSKLSKDYEGSGIGLSLVKSFVDLHQGTINVSSEINKGSEFVITLPLRKLDTHYEKPSEPVISDRNSKIIEAVNIEFSNCIAS